MNKLPKDTTPSNHSFADFVSFGPVAEKDGEFDNVMMADFGCFNQDGSVDSNKFYFGALIQSSKTNDWYAYFEWGKVGGHHQFQFLACDSKEEAIKEFQKQLHSKNDKRGEWFEHPTLGKMLRAKKNKDCYLVRKQTSRNVNIISAQNISNETKQVPTNTAKASDLKPDLHPECSALLKDLQLGSISYTKSSITGDTPTQSAIDEARLILKTASATKKLSELQELTRILYCKVPKIKYKGVDVTLSADNIVEWANDLDAFESAIGSSTSEEIRYENYVRLEYIEKNTEFFREIDNWINSATRNKHGYISGKMKIRNIYVLYNDTQYKQYKKYQKAIIVENVEKPLHQPNTEKLKPSCDKSNTAILFHGSRSANVSRILKSGKLLLPKALSGVSINGSLYGAGSYFADDWKKSAGYCSIDNSAWVRGQGKINSRKAFMFIAHTVLGKPKVEMSPKGYSQPPVGFNSVMGKMGTNVLNNEFIIYDENANILNYLVEFEV